MASRFASVTEKQILSLNEAAVPKNINITTKFGLTVSYGKLFSLSKLLHVNFCAQKSIAR